MLNENKLESGLNRFYEPHSYELIVQQEELRATLLETTIY